jgi:hypothetical protein
VSGPIATLLLAVLLDQLARHGLLGFNPVPLLLLVVAGAAVRGGVWSGVVSGVLAALYAVHYYDSRLGVGLNYTPSDARDLLLVCAIAPVLGASVGYATRAVRVLESGSGPADVLRLIDECAALLGSSLDYPATLQATARRIVPALADWCTIHLDEGTGSSGTGAAHHDLAREVFVQGLRRYPPRGFPEAVSGAGEIRTVDSVQLHAWAQDDDHLDLLRALAPGAMALLPLTAGGRTIGLLTLGFDDLSPAVRDTKLTAARLLAELSGKAVERAQLAATRATAEAEHHVLFEHHPAPMWIFDPDSLAFLAVNEAAVRHYGWSRDEFQTMTLMDLRAADEAMSSFEGHDAPRADVALAQHRRKDGSRIQVEITSGPVTYHGRRARLALVYDVTDRVRAKAALLWSEEQRRQTQRMDTAGRLAGGVAHDFNNLLTAIQGYTEILADAFAPDDPRRADVAEVRKAAERGAMLSRQLLAFGERQRLAPRPVDLNVVVGQMESLIQRLVGADVQVEIVRAPEVGFTRVDPALLEQVLVSLVLNAREAMPSGGTLTVETMEREIGPSGRNRSLQPGRYVVLTVSDTGAGADGSGTRGLPIVYGIVRQSGGVVRVTGEPGRGTAVKVYFPTVEATEEPAASDVPLGGDETVLVVEDEEAVRALLRKVLQRQGYTVIEARHGTDALRRAARHHGHIDLLLTDVVMPEMGGVELAERLRAARPGLCTLFISGYSTIEAVRRGVEVPGSGFVQKPFTSGELLRAARALLDAPPNEDASPHAGAQPLQ